MASIPIRAAAQVSHRSPPGPLPQGVVDHGYRYTLVQRVHCLILLTEGWSVADIEKKLAFQRDHNGLSGRRRTIVILGQKRTPGF
jgi:hypothetical protein